MEEIRNGLQRQHLMFKTHFSLTHSNNTITSPSCEYWSYSIFGQRSSRFRDISWVSSTKCISWKDCWTGATLAAYRIRPIWTWHCYLQISASCKWNIKPQYFLIENWSHTVLFIAKWQMSVAYSGLQERFSNRLSAYMYVTYVWLDNSMISDLACKLYYFVNWKTNARQTTFTNIF